MDTTRNIGNMFKPTAFQEVGDLHAASSVVAQAGDWPLRVELGKPRWNDAHRNGQQGKSVGADTGSLQFIGLAHVQHHGFTSAALLS